MYVIYKCQNICIKNPDPLWFLPNLLNKYMSSIYKYIYIYIYLYIKHIYIYIHGWWIYTNDGFLKVPIKSWPKWDLNPRPLNSVRRSNRLNYRAMNSTHSHSQATPVSTLCSVFTFHFGVSLHQSPHLLLSEVSHR